MWMIKEYADLDRCNHECPEIHYQRDLSYDDEFVHEEVVQRDEPRPSLANLHGPDLCEACKTYLNAGELSAQEEAK